MSIVLTEVESVHGDMDKQRMVFYRCKDDQGNWHPYGPYIIKDQNFVPESLLSMIAEKVANSLAEEEFDQVLEEI